MSRIKFLFMDKNLTSAIILSTLWHFFWIVSVVPFFTYSSARVYGQTMVSFLGSVLNEIMPEDRRFDKGEKRDSEESGLAEISLERPVFYSKPLIFEKDEGITYKKRLVEFKKRAFKAWLIFEEVARPSQFFIIEGVAKQRELLYRPKFPSHPKWLLFEDVPYEVKLRFFISPNGEVLRVEKLISSGSPVLDEICFRYVKGLKFLPLPKDRSDRLDEGIVELKF